MSSFISYPHPFFISIPFPSPPPDHPFSLPSRSLDSGGSADDLAGFSLHEGLLLEGDASASSPLGAGSEGAFADAAR